MEKRNKLVPTLTQPIITEFEQPAHAKPQQNKLKKYVLVMFSSLQILLLASPTSLKADNPLAGLPPIDPIELLNSMDPKELDKLMEELSRMSPEEIAYYENLGKQMFKDSGYDVDAIAQGVPPAQALIKPNNNNNQPKINKPNEPKTIDNSSKKEKDSLMRMIKTLMDSLASIRQKAGADETLHPHITKLSQELDLLHAYLNRMDYEKHLKHFEEKEFSALKTKLRKLSLNLEELDSNLFVPKLSLEKRPSGQPTNRSLLEKATGVLKQFSSTMKDAFGPNTLLTDIENLFKKYDQDALNIKKHIEEQYKKASDQTLKIQSTKTNTGIFPTIPKYGQPVAGNGKQGYPSASGSGQSNYPAGTRQNPAGAAGQPGQKAGAAAGPTKPGDAAAKTKSAEEGEKKKEDGKEAAVPLTLEERIEKVKKELRAVNMSVGNNKPSFLRLTDDLLALETNPAAARKINEVTLNKLEEVNYSFKKAQDEVGKIITEANKKDLQTTQKSRKDLKDFMETQLPNVTEVQARFGSVDFRGFAQPLNSDITSAKELIESFNGMVTKTKSAALSRKI